MTDLQSQIACEAARIIIDERREDYYRAAQMARDALGFGPQVALPSSDTVAECVVGLLRAEDESGYQRRWLSMLDEVLQAMRFFTEFEPALVGALLQGAATQDAIIELHLFADAPEDVMFMLMQKKIPFREMDRNFSLGKGEKRVPGFAFEAGSRSVRVWVFPYETRR